MKKEEILLMNLGDSVVDSSSSWLGVELRLLGYDETPRKVINDQNAWDLTGEQFFELLTERAA